MFDRLSDDATRMMSLARKSAIEARHEHIDTAHLLLGLLALPESGGCRLLAGLGVPLDRLRAALERRMSPGSKAVSVSALPFTPGTKKVMELAMESAASLGHNWLGTEHLLLGLLLEGKATAAQALRELGVTEEQLRPGAEAAERPAASPAPLDVRAAEILVGMLHDEHSVLVRALRVAGPTTPYALREAIRSVLSGEAPPG